VATLARDPGMNDSKNDNRPARRPGTRVVTGGHDPAA
jgi:hypothetical protein